MGHGGGAGGRAEGRRRQAGVAGLQPAGDIGGGLLGLQSGHPSPPLPTPPLGPRLRTLALLVGGRGQPGSVIWTLGGSF